MSALLATTAISAVLARTEIPPKVKVIFKDLKARGIVRSRHDLHQKIQNGKIRPPYKDGEHQQSAAWWYWHELLVDLDREYAELKAGQSGPSIKSLENSAELSDILPHAQLQAA